MARRDTPHILLVNPWIHDFAAYDFWAKPMGLLQLAAILRDHGLRVSYLDCLDRHFPGAEAADGKKRNGRGPYRKEPIAKPAGLQDVKRTYSRYGIPVTCFRQSLLSLDAPDLILVTSSMTYWYSGVQETIEVVRSVFKDRPVFLGGVYASLCSEHAAKTSGADKVVSGPGEQCILDIIAEQTAFSAAPRFDAAVLDTYPYPAYDLMRRVDYVPLLTSRGCPFRCAYCASGYLQPERLLRSPQSVVDEILFWHEDEGIVDFAFYDDALLVDAERHFLPMLEKIITGGLDVKFHTPNAIHVREISRKAAELMYKAGFETIRLGVETADFERQRTLDAKVTADEFSKGIHCLKDAGFRREQIGAYLLVGLPYQSLATVIES
ncbi:MAG: radical SAM protein, partial [Deltaproteobacteria bacterium]